MYAYYGWAPYVPVGQRLANAKMHVQQQLKGKANPVVPLGKGRKITTTFWGTAWCNNLEAYSDFENRMPRGRTYIRNGSVVHLEIGEGVVKSFIAGSDTYKIVVHIDPLKPTLWEAIKKKCSGEIGSVVELLQGKLSKHVLGIVTDLKEGLFPSPEEIRLDCSCPDWASMCKHVAATLYGVGVLLDKSPELFFKLRGVDHLELIDSSVSLGTGKMDKETLDDGSLEDIFGLELSDGMEAQPKRKNAAARKKVGVKKTVKKTVKKVAKKAVKKAAKKASKKVVKKALRKVVKETVSKPVKQLAQKKSSKTGVKKAAGKVKGKMAVLVVQVKKSAKKSVKTKKQTKPKR